MVRRIGLPIDLIESLRRKSMVRKFSAMFSFVFISCFKFGSSVVLVTESILSQHNSVIY